MKVIKPGYEILDLPKDPREIYKKIERAGRTCYKSEDRITDYSAEKFVRAMVRNGHEAMLEHASLSVVFTVDRGVSHEIVRHRIASFAQESTRYCSYDKEKFGGELTFISPCFWEKGSVHYNEWVGAMRVAETVYLGMLAEGVKPEEARAVLPNSLKTELVVTASIREWRHIFKLRAAGETGKPHPQMMEVMIPLLEELKEKLPALFFDIEPMT